MSGQTWLENIGQDFQIGDRVEVTSVVTARRRRNRPSRHATGIVTGYNDSGIVVEFDCGLVNGVTWCTASPLELRHRGPA